MQLFEYTPGHLQTISHIPKEQQKLNRNDIYVRTSSNSYNQTDLFLAKYQLSTKANSNNLAFEIVFLQVVWSLLYSRRTAKSPCRPHHSTRCSDSSYVNWATRSLQDYVLVDSTLQYMCHLNTRYSGPPGLLSRRKESVTNEKIFAGIACFVDSFLCSYSSSFDNCLIKLFLSACSPDCG